MLRMAILKAAIQRCAGTLRNHSGLEEHQEEKFATSLSHGYSRRGGFSYASLADKIGPLYALHAAAAAAAAAA